jgi:hypothetical protein
MKRVSTLNHILVFCLNSLEGCHAERSEASGLRKRSQHRTRKNVRWPDSFDRLRTGSSLALRMTSDGAVVRTPGLGAIRKEVSHVQEVNVL